MTPEPASSGPFEDGTSGPEDLAQAVLSLRNDPSCAVEDPGNISAAGLRCLIRLAYHASQTANEGRYPRMTLLVSAAGKPPTFGASFEERLSVSVLRRLGPVVSTPRLALVVEERGGQLWATGVSPVEDPFGGNQSPDPDFAPRQSCGGLKVEIIGPGDLRAGEWGRHRLSAGSLRREKSYKSSEWFTEWANEAAVELFGDPPSARVGLGVGALWQYTVNKVIHRRHGGCLVILHDPSSAPIRHAFVTSGCDIGDLLTRLRRSTFPAGTGSGPVRDVPQLLNLQLDSAIDCVVQFSATDGCVVFDRRLRVGSFGSMIELDGAVSATTCYLGDSETPLDAVALRTFGARRRSAIQLCQSCPGALAFVISQDGDLRAVVNRGGAVRLYENLPSW